MVGAAKLRDWVTFVSGRDPRNEKRPGGEPGL